MDLDHVSLIEAKRALQDNALKHLTPKSAPALHNLNIALLGICHSLDRLTLDLEFLHAKLQPVLKEIIEDQHHVQDQTRR